MEIWHNPRCSKSRAAKTALDEAGVEYTERRYLEDPPTAQQLATALDRLGLEPWEITRTGEAVAKEIGLADVPRDADHREDWITALTAHPQLIQRPIVISSSGQAIVARDPDGVEAIRGWS